MVIVCPLLTLYLLVVLVRIVMSWFPLEPGGPGAQVYGVLFSLTEPVLGPLRRLIPPVRLGGMALDLSPILVFFGIQVLLAFLC